MNGNDGSQQDLVLYSQFVVFWKSISNLWLTPLSSFRGALTVGHQVLYRLQGCLNVLRGFVLYGAIVWWRRGGDAPPSFGPCTCRGFNPCSPPFSRYRFVCIFWWFGRFRYFHLTSTSSDIPIEKSVSSWSPNGCSTCFGLVGQHGPTPSPHLHAIC